MRGLGGLAPGKFSEPRPSNPGTTQATPFLALVLALYPIKTVSIIFLHELQFHFSPKVSLLSNYTINPYEWVHLWNFKSQIASWLSKGVCQKHQRQMNQAGSNFHFRITWVLEREEKGYIYLSHFPSDSAQVSRIWYLIQYPHIFGDSPHNLRCKMICNFDVRYKRM